MKKRNNPEFVALIGMIVTFALAIAVLSGSLHYVALRSRQDMNERLDQMKYRMESIEKNQDEAFEILEEIRHGKSSARIGTLSTVDIPTNVIFTNYYIGDGSNSADITASGLTTKDFEVNTEGFYTYGGKVVVATANTTRLKRDLFQGYDSHELYEELEIEVNGQTHEAVVVDVCGACYGVRGEDKQRYDIFTTKNVIGKSLGSVYK